VLYMIDRVRSGDFYILCPDNEARKEVDQLRIMWAAGGASFPSLANLVDKPHANSSHQISPRTDLRSAAGIRRIRACSRNICANPSLHSIKHAHRQRLGSHRSICMYVE
jgi:hypothetical protein